MFEKLCAMVAEIMNVDPSDVTENTPLRARDGLSDLDFARLVIAARSKYSKARDNARGLPGRRC